MGLFNLFKRTKTDEIVKKNENIECVKDLVDYLKTGDLQDRKVTDFLKRIVEDYDKYRKESLELLCKSKDIDEVSLLSTVYLSISNSIQSCYNMDTYLKASLEYENTVFFNDIDSLYNEIPNKEKFINKFKEFVNNLKERIHIIEDNKPEDIFVYNPFYDCVLFNMVTETDKLQYTGQLNVY